MVRLSDIAKDLGLSLSVVSRALSVNPDKYAVVKKETAERIRKYAQEVGYTPNRQASFLGKGKCATIFCFLPDVPTRLIADLMFGIAEAARELNFPVNFFLGKCCDDLSCFLRDSKRNPHSGLLTFPPSKMPAQMLSDVEQYHKAGGNILILNTISNSGAIYGSKGFWGIPSLNIDEAYGGKLAASHLLQCGCDRFFVLSEGHPDIYNTREQGFADYLHEKNRDFTLVTAGELAALKIPPGEKWGFFADSDYSALNQYALFETKKWKFGENVFLCGFDDIFYSRISNPSLTTIHQPTREEGRAALRELVSMIFGKQGKDQLMKPWLCHRETTGGRRPDPEFPENENRITDLV